MSDFEKIDYLDASMWRIRTESQLYQHALTFLHTTWGTSTKNFFPGAQPISIERVHFPILKRGRYVVCEKTDGIRHACACFMFGDKKMCVLIDRSQTMYLLPIKVPTSMFQGTLLDGELVKSTADGKWYYMVYDCLLIDNVHVAHLDSIKRLENAERFAKGITRMTKDPLTVKMKTMWDLKTGFRECVTKEYPYKTDGLVFTPVNEPVRSGTHETLFKWKMRDANTIDFQFKRRSPAVWGMYVQEKGKLIFESEIRDDQIEVPLALQEDSIVECHYVHWEFPRWWRPLHIRTDKKHPNNRRTFYRTLNNIAENIELIEFETL
jgi:hypothetical protein